LFFLIGYVEIGHGQVIVLDDSSLDLDFVSKTAFDMLDSIGKDNMLAIQTQTDLENHAKLLR